MDEDEFDTMMDALNDAKDIYVALNMRTKYNTRTYTCSNQATALHTDPKAGTDWEDEGVCLTGKAFIRNYASQSVAD
jgi:hypothetical protein